MEDPAYTDILSRLRKVSRRYVFVSVAEALLASSAAGAGLFLVFSAAEAVFYFSPAVKTPLFWLVWLLTAAVFAALCVVRFAAFRLRPVDAAHLVERAYPGLDDRLVSAVQLGSLKSGELRGQSDALVKALLRKVEAETRGMDVARAVPTRNLLRAARSTYAVAAVFLLSVTLFPSGLSGGIYRFLDHTHVYLSPSKNRIYLLAGNGSIVRGDDFSVSGVLSGRRLEPLSVLYRFEGSQTWNVKPVEVDTESGKFTVTIEKPGRRFRYYLESGSAATPRYTVRVIERPVVEKIEYELSYPAYTGLGTISRSDNDGNVRALVGTRVSMRVHANKPLSRMVIHWSDSTAAECDVSGAVGETAFSVDKTVDYHFTLVDTLGITNRNPIEYRVTALTDENPSVEIVSPSSGEYLLPLSMEVPLAYRATDDYGLTAVVLRFRLPFERNFREVTLESGGMGVKTEGNYTWSLSETGLLPDDVVEYNLVVYDNDTVNGPKTGISGTGRVRVPSMTDYITDSIEERERGIEKLREMSRRAVEDDEALDEVRRNIINGEDLDWSDRNALEEARNRMERIRENLKGLSDELKKAVERLSEKDMGALETLDKYRKISELMDEIVEGDLKDALRRLTQVSVQLEPDRLKRAIDEHKVTAEELKKKLDRIISLLEQVKAVQRFEMARKLVEEMAFKEAELSARYRRDPESPGLSREQKKLASEAGPLTEELKEAARELRERFDLKTEGFKEYVDSLKLPETMKDAARNIAEGRGKEARKALDRSNMKLSELLERMDMLGEAMQSASTGEMRRRLFTALTDMLAVSRKQEALLAEIEGGGVSGGTVSPAERELEIIDALAKAERSIESFGELAVEVSGVFSNLMTMVKATMEGAVDAFAVGDTVRGAGIAGNALKDLNNSIHILTMFLSSRDGGGKGMPGDLFQQLQKIAKGEMSLQNMLGSAASEEMMMKLAAEQQLLSRMLSELARKLAEDERLRGMLEKLAEEMDDTADMMRRNEKREFIERKQLDIYRRLLDARRSRRTKDEEEKRKSMTAKRSVSKGAESLPEDLGEKRPDLNERIKRAMMDDFDPEYLRLIRRYFESMLRDSPGAGAAGK